MSDAISGVALVNLLTSMDPNDLLSPIDLPKPASPRPPAMQQNDELTLSATAQMQAMKIMSEERTPLTSSSPQAPPERLAPGAEENQYPVPSRAFAQTLRALEKGDVPLKPQLVVDNSITPRIAAHTSKEALLSLVPQPGPQLLKVSRTDIAELEEVAAVLARTIPHPTATARSVHSLNPDTPNTLKLAAVLVLLLLLLAYLVF